LLIRCWRAHFAQAIPQTIRMAAPKGLDRNSAAASLAISGLPMPIQSAKATSLAGLRPSLLGSATLRRSPNSGMY